MRVPLTIRREPIAAGAFSARVAQSIGGPLKALSIRTVQVNIGLRCTLSCSHCHVQSSPRRVEQMTWETMKLALLAARRVRAATLDITGGEPALHPEFRKLVEAARHADLQVMVRTNLIVLLKSDYATLPAFFRKHRVRLIASLPSCQEHLTDAQRGKGVFRQSMEAIKILNAVGYGIEPTLPLDLVHNPPGPWLPPRQSALEFEYKRDLGERFGIRFTQLSIMTNMPIGRFEKELERDGKLETYQQKLESGYNPDTLEGLSCRHQLHIAWDGTLYDCDYNCGLRLKVREDTPSNIRDFNPTTFLQRRIANADHCFGCTAGRGSSWSGAIV